MLSKIAVNNPEQLRDFAAHRRIGHQESTDPGPGGAKSEHIQFDKNIKARLRIRVLVADDHPVMRTGLSEIINHQDDMEVIGQAGNGEEAVRIASRVKPDVILMDVSMPVLDGIEATRKIKSLRPETCVIGLTMFEDPVVDAEMKIAGAARCLTKSCPTEVLLETIRSCFTGF